MILGPHALPGAYFDTLACVGMMRDEPAVRRLEALSRGLQASVDPMTSEAGRQLAAAVMHARAAASSWSRVRPGSSDDGTAEPPPPAPDATCPRPPKDGSGGPELTVREAARRLRASESYVTRLCREGTKLRGRQPSGRGGPWLIDAESVAEHEASRRRVA